MRALLPPQANIKIRTLFNLGSRTTLKGKMSTSKPGTIRLVQKLATTEDSSQSTSDVLLSDDTLSGGNMNTGHDSGEMGC